VKKETGSKGGKGANVLPEGAFSDCAADFNAAAIDEAAAAGSLGWRHREQEMGRKGRMS
jgi:hypothetical protein